jgi:hypothetical protein
MRSQRLKFIAALAAIVLLRSLDLFLTFLYIPDLDREWNPVVAFLNGDWTHMILVQIIVIAVISVPLYGYFTFSRTRIDEPGLGYNQFVYFYFFMTRPRGLKRLFAMPKNFKGTLIFNGFVLMWAVIGVSLFAIVHNMLLLCGFHPYERFVIAHTTPYIITAYLVIAAVPVYTFFLREYAAYRKRMRSRAAEEKAPNT